MTTPQHRLWVSSVRQRPTADDDAHATAEANCLQALASDTRRRLRKETIASLIIAAQPPPPPPAAPSGPPPPPPIPELTAWMMAAVHGTLSQPAVALPPAKDAPLRESAGHLKLGRLLARYSSPRRVDGAEGRATSVGIVSTPRGARQVSRRPRPAQSSSWLKVASQAKEQHLEWEVMLAPPFRGALALEPKIEQARAHIEQWEGETCRRDGKAAAEGGEVRGEGEVTTASPASGAAQRPEGWRGGAGLLEAGRHEDDARDDWTATAASALDA